MLKGNYLFPDVLFISGTDRIYLIYKKTSMDQLKKHGPYILVRAFYLRDGQTREKKPIKGKCLEYEGLYWTK